ncbi:cyclin-dependent kinase 2-interacting protein-like isoform X2 [Glandiceps talaboti]
MAETNKTPKKKRHSTSGDSVSRQSPKPTALTGSSRKIKDHCADWHNYINKWETLNDQGFGVVSKIANCKIQAQSNESTEKTVNVITGSRDVNSSDDAGHKMPVELEEFCTQLETVYNSLAKLVKKMETICTNFKGVCNLELHQNNGSWSEDPLFQTWPTKLFYDASCELLSMYQKELPVKQTILQEIAHTVDRDLLMFYVATWLHQPYIEDKSKTLLESMLVETGHR